jgi:hypothetical protein
MSPCGMARAMTPRFSSPQRPWPTGLGRLEEWAAAGLVLDQFDGAEHALAAHVADILGRRAPRSSGVEIGADGAGVFDQAEMSISLRLATPAAAPIGCAE